MAIKLKSQRKVSKSRLLTSERKELDALIIPPPAPLVPWLIDNLRCAGKKNGTGGGEENFDNLIER